MILNGKSGDAATIPLGSCMGHGGSVPCCLWYEGQAADRIALCHHPAVAGALNCGREIENQQGKRPSWCPLGRGPDVWRREKP